MTILCQWADNVKFFPDIIDPAVLRPGRLDKTLHVGLPTLGDRIDILKTITKNCKKPRIEGVELSELAALPQCDGFRYLLFILWVLL